MSPESRGLEVETPWTHFFLPVASFCMGLGGAWHVRVGSHGTGAGGSAFGVVLARLGSVGACFCTVRARVCAWPRNFSVRAPSILIWR